jgi:hypothetical protein
MMKKHWLGLMSLTALATLTSFVPKAGAYEYNYCNDKRIQWGAEVGYVELRTHSGLSSDYEYQVKEGKNRWNEIGSGNFSYTLIYDDTSVGLKNGQNEIWFSTDDSLSGGTGRAHITYYNCNTSVVATIVEADVVFDPNPTNTTWTASSYPKSSLTPYGGTFRPFDAGVVHELGHVAGLAHETDEYNVMGEDFTHIYSDGYSAYAYVGEDAAAGLVDIYGYGYNQDVSVNHWKWVGVLNSSNGSSYSDHSRTQMYDSSGNVLSSYTDAGEPRYRVNRGQAVQVEFTYENSGSYADSNNLYNVQTVTRDFYISTYPKSGASGDRWLKADTTMLDRWDTRTARDTVTIPSNLAPGKYYIGVYLDWYDQLDEVWDYYNNTSYIAIEVQ